MKLLLTASAAQCDSSWLRSATRSVCCPRGLAVFRWIFGMEKRENTSPWKTSLLLVFLTCGMTCHRGWREQQRLHRKFLIVPSTGCGIFLLFLCSLVLFRAHDQSCLLQPTKGEKPFPQRTHTTTVTVSLLLTVATVKRDTAWIYFIGQYSASTAGAVTSVES